MKRVGVILRDPDGVVVEARTFGEDEHSDLTKFVGEFVYGQGIDPDVAGPGLSGTVEFEPVVEVNDG